jgi:hypothetical protein
MRNILKNAYPKLPLPSSAAIAWEHLRRMLRAAQGALLHQKLN